MDRLDRIREDLDILRRRWVQDEIDDDAYARKKAQLLADLTPSELTELGLTPAPRPRGRLGPSGGETRVPVTPELQFEPGVVLLDQWRIVRELGRGGFGVVYEAEDVKLGRTVAVKVLDPTMAAREDLLRRFRREVALMRELTHQRVVRVYDYREETAQHLALITMECIKGCDVRVLHALARQGGAPMPLPLALSIFQQTLEALGAAHEKGVIHRDVTPGNILLAGGSAADLLTNPESDPRVKLVDFGIAGLIERTELSAKSRVLGTAAYVAPEVLDPDAEIKPEADTYGAGAVIYEMLTGKTPMVTGFSPIEDLRPDLPSGVAAVINAAIRAQPDRRPTPGQALADLRRGRKPSDGEARQAGEPKTHTKALPASGGQPGTKPSRVSPLIILVLLAVLVPVLVALGLKAGRGWIIFPPTEPTPQSIVTLTPTPILEAVQNLQPTAVSIQQHQEVIVPTPSTTPIAIPTQTPVPAPSPRPTEKSKATQVQRRPPTPVPTAMPSPIPTVVPTVIPSPTPTPKPAGLGAGAKWRDPAVGMSFRAIPAGTFEMGSPVGEKGRDRGERQHRVTITRGFWMGETEVTQGQWKAVMGSNPSYFPRCGADCPVEQVSWFAVVRFANALSRKAGFEQCYQISGETVTFKGLSCTGYRLPTEAEWEYAARAGTTDRYPGGNDFDAVGWSNDNSGRETRQVGTKRANAWGLHDMSGNVWEWVWDWKGMYPSAAVTDPTGPSSGFGRVMRGGSWYGSAESCRSAVRDDSVPLNQFHFFGFRLARTAAK